MNRLLILVAMATLVRCQGDIDDLVLQEIFGTNNQTSGTGLENHGNLEPTPAQVTLAPASQNENHQQSNDELEECLTDDNMQGKCVPYYLCSIDNNTIIDDGTGIIDIRLRDGPCKNYLDFCCRLPNARPVENPVTQPPPKEERTGCGWRNPNGVGFRIQGAQDGESNFAEFPWMVAILTIEPVNDNEPDGRKLNVYVGGGSLIHPSVVLTAAHVVYNVWKKKEMRVRAGEWDTQTKREAYPYQDRDVVDVAIHKDFNNRNLFYDIAVLYLSNPMELAPNVGLVCLPPPRERQVDGTRCLASGWGKDQFGKEGRYQVILKKIELPVVERNSCQNKLRKTRLGAVFQLHSSFMCAGGEAGKDTCKGDGGSPLVCPVEYEHGRYMQSGIVAWGIGCGADGAPGVYVDVSNLREWVDNAVAAKGHDVSVYAV